MRNVRRYPERTAMINPPAGRTWTYSELNADCNRLADAFIADGLKPGDVVMLQLLNCPEFVLSYIASHKTQAVCCPVNFRLSAGELAYNLTDSRPKVLMFEAQKEEEVREAIRLSGYCPQRLVSVGSGKGSEADSLGITGFDDYVNGRSTQEPHMEREYSIYDETTRLYTSGTTGHPKAVPLTSINEVLSAHDVMIHFPLNYRDISMNTTPWFHRGGLHCAGPCPTLYAGGALVIMNKFDAVLALRYTQRYKITFLVGVPTVLEELADAQDVQGYDLSSLHGIVTMGSPLERSACIRYQKSLTSNIFNGYGTTETFWNTFLRPFDLPENAGTAGASCVDDDVRVVKIYEDRRAEPDELVEQDDMTAGEVIICSPAKSPYSYACNEDETMKKFYKGFVYTGDLATWNKDSFITIKGRKDDMIISSGENIYPAEVEEVLNTHPGVKESIVTSVPDKMRGQLVTAYIVRSDESLTAEQLDEYCKESPYIANFKRPRYYRFVQQIPVNATGKKLHNKIKLTALADLKNGLLCQP